MNSQDSRAIWELIVALRRIEVQHAVDCGHYPGTIVVFAGGELYDTLWRCWNGEMMWRFDILTGELLSAGVRARTTVVRAVAPDAPAWGYSAVIGSEHTGMVSAADTAGPGPDAARRPGPGAVVPNDDRQK